MDTGSALNPRKTATGFQTHCQPQETLLLTSMATGPGLFRTHQNAAVSVAPPNYGEVFGRHHGDDGVPVLKLPAVVDHVEMDLGLVDYTQVFGRYDDWSSFAPSYDQVLRKSNTVPNDAAAAYCWTQLEAPLPLENAYNSIPSAQCNILLSENGQESSDSDRRPSLSGQREHLVNFTRACPSYKATRVVDGSSHFKEPDRSGSNRRDRNCSEEIVLDTEERDATRVDIMFQNGSQLKEGFLTYSGISLRTHPSRCPPPSRQPPMLDIQTEDLNGRRTNQKGGRSRSHSFQDTLNLPIIYDVEVDASSAAAASAAMLDAMEKAQANLKRAKEVMERKKKGVLCHLKLSEKKSFTESDIDGSNKLNENLVQKVKVAAEGRKSFTGDGYKNVTSTPETVSQSMNDTKQNSALYELIMRRERRGSWSFGDSDISVGVNEVFWKPVEDVLSCKGNKEVLWYEQSSKERTANRQPVGVCNSKEMACERASMEDKPSHKNVLNSSDDCKGTKKQLVGANWCDENDVLMEVLQEPNFTDINDQVKQESQKDSSFNKRTSTDGRAWENNKLTSKKCYASEDGKEKEVEIADSQGEHQKMKIGFEFEEVCIKVRNLRMVSLACGPDDSYPSIKEPYGLNMDTEGLGAVSKWQTNVGFTLSRDGREPEKPQLDNDNTSMNVCRRKQNLSEDRFIDKMAEVVKPLHLSCDPKEKQESNAEIVKSDKDTNLKPRLNDDTLEFEPMEKNVLVSTPTSEDNNTAKVEKIKGVMINDIRMPNLNENDKNLGAAATGNRASQEIMIRSHTLSESNDLEELLITESVDDAMLTNEVQVPISVPSENSTRNHQSSDEAAKDLLLENDEKMLRRHLKKLEKEREREREKDSLVVDISLHEVHTKAQNDECQRVEKAAVETDTVKSKELQADSPQRRKARLERERRTADRAARALAEKNMRDLAAQRELAERNRLTNSLGAEVKRWASGKEGNLRSLLSTLQYILGPDSGWKPIPLTDVITPVAVKKAYRKATLYVHPDKVQQRGANIQQKFVCEKIFDLLKDAWNKFNSEGL